MGTTCAADEFCCETQCCSAGMLCCTVTIGPVVTECMNPTAEGTCPTGCADCDCMPPDTRITTPSGERAISTLQPGDVVYSIDDQAIRAVPIRNVLKNPVSEHHIVKVVLSGGVVVEASPGHPTADGRTFADLAAGNKLNDSVILDVSVLPYPHAFTYDILPGSSTGTYVANGVMIGSTLFGRTQVQDHHRTSAQHRNPVE